MSERQTLLHLDPKSPEGWRKHMKLILAVLSIAGMIVSWITLAELLQALQGKSSKSYDKPFFTVYFIHAFGYMLFLVIWGIWYLVAGRRKERENRSYRAFPIQDTEDGVPLEPYSMWKLAKIALCFCPIMFISAWTWIWSLPGTTVALNTGIYNTASIFVFIFSVILLKEKLSVIKVVSVILSLVGVAVVSFTSTHQHDSGTEQNTVWGVLLVVISTVLYAFYEVIYKKYAVDPANPQSPSNTVFFLGAAGFWCFIIFWPVFIILNYTGYEKFEWPPQEALAMLFLNLGLDCIFNILLLLGIMLSSPLFISIGTLLTVPTSILSDWLVHDYLFPPPAWIGVGLIVLGFIGQNIAEAISHKNENDE